MSTRPHLRCLYHDDGSRPKPFTITPVVFDPTCQMPGSPTLMGHRMGAENLARLAMARGVPYVHSHEMYPHLTRDEVVMACWWAGLWGPKKLRQYFGEWANEAGNHLWYRCGGFADPPVAGVA